jgi:hypothetical protein
VDKFTAIHTPILLIGFNRPEIIQQSFDYIRRARPEKLYIVIDGPREGRDGEVDLVNRVKQIVQKVDWPCETHYTFNETNKGAEVTVSSAISWVFEKEEFAIILEDDIIAPMSFLKFAQEMLIRYNDVERIGTVSGSNFTPLRLPGDADYFFAKYGHSWGWATWKRAWNGFNLNVEVPEDHLKLDFLKTITNTKQEAKYFQKRIRNIKEKGPGNSTWDSVGNYNHRINNRLSVIPKVNITSNIGTYGLHAKGITEHHYRPFDENFVVKKHPDKISCFNEYDIYHFKTYINKRPPFCKLALRKMKRVLSSEKRNL